MLASDFRVFIALASAKVSGLLPLSVAFGSTCVDAGELSIVHPLLCCPSAAMTAVRLLFYMDATDIGTGMKEQIRDFCWSEGVACTETEPSLHPR